MIGGVGPEGPNAFASAVDWLNATVLGTLAPTIAVLAVASIGFLLLSGRVDARRAMQVVLGCFILFGASTIAGGIMGVGDAAGELRVAEAPLSPPPPVYPPTVPSAQETPSAFDPYAGAALPARGTR